LLFAINEQMARTIQKLLIHVSLAKHYASVKRIKYCAEVLCFQLPRSKDACKRPPISIPNLALAVEVVHKGFAVQAPAKQFSVAHATLQDILMITRKVITNSSSKAINVQYAS
jgi:hypothetical protein